MPNTDPMIGVLRVLVVDDHVGTLNLIALQLGSYAYVATASGVAEACYQLGTRPFDVVVTDDRMQDGSGRALLLRVRERWPATKRVLMSGDDVPAERELDPPWQWFLRKPFAIQALLEILG